MVVKSTRFRYGFTIVELLIVIVVVAILVSISILAYIGVTSRASAASVQADANSAYKQLETIKASSSTGTYPVDLASANLKSSPGTAYTYYPGPGANSYCLEATNNSSTYSVSSASPVVQSVKCGSNGLTVYLDASNSQSYPGSGITWYNLAGSLNGTIYNGATYNATDGGGSLVFDGSNDYVGLNSNSNSPIFTWTPAGRNATPTITLEFWVKTSDGSGLIYSRPWNGNGEYNFMVGAGFFGLGVQPDYSQIYFANSVATGSWTQLIVWANQTTLGYYINGGLYSGSVTHNITNNIPASGDMKAASIMTWYPYGEGTWNIPSHAILGSLGIVRIYNRVLSQAEISQNYATFRGRYGI